MKFSLVILFAALLAIASAQTSYFEFSIDAGTTWFRAPATPIRFHISTPLQVRAQCVDATVTPAATALCTGVTWAAPTGATPAVTTPAGNPGTITPTAPTGGDTVAIVNNNLNQAIVVSASAVTGAVATTAPAAITVVPSTFAQIGANANIYPAGSVTVTRTGGLDLHVGAASVFTSNCQYTNVAAAEVCPFYASTWTTAATGTFVPAATNPHNPIAFVPSATQTGQTLGVSVDLDGAGAGTAATANSASFAVTAAQGRDYAAQPGDLKPRWLVTLVNNDVSENLQWTPGNDGTTVDPVLPSPGAGTAPYAYIDPANPSAPQTRPVARVPLYWGNSYRVRVGLTNTNGQYCGTIGQWPAGTNARNTAPTAGEIAAARTAGLAGTGNTNDIEGPFGCTDYIEQNDRWTIPVPTQSLPTAAPGYTTIAAQTGSNPLIDSATGIVRFSLVGSTAASADMVFTGLALPTDWVNSCVQGLEASVGVQFPCGWREQAVGTVIAAPRFNPDPQVWQISATGTQPARFTAIGVVGVTPNNLATPPVPLSLLEQTNDIAVWFTYPLILNPRTAATGVPAQAAITNIPRCEPTAAFVPDTEGLPAAPANIEGIQVFPTCNQGLVTAACTAAQATANTNCGFATPAAAAPFTPNPAQAAGEAFGLTLTAVTSSTAGTGNPVNPSKGTSTALSGIFIAQSPLQILLNSAAAVLNKGDGAAQSVTYNAGVRQATIPFTLGFPLFAGASPAGSKGNSISDNYWNDGALRGGNVTIDPIAVFECPATGVGCLDTSVLNPNYRAGSLTDFFGATPPSIVVSQSSPTGLLSFTGLPRPTSGNSWRMYFRVTDTAGAGAAAYESIPFMTINVNPIEVVIPNFPPVNGIFYITQPNAVAPNHYHYTMHIEKSPAALGLTSVSVGFTITPPSAASALQFYVNNAQVNAFTFTDTQTTIDFLVYTSATPVSSFSITFNDSNNVPLGLPAAATGLSVRANPISVKTQLASNVGPFVGEPFFLELTFSPPATGTFTVVAAAGSLATGSATTVTVNVNDTGVLMGPLIPILPSNVLPAANSFGLPIALRVEGTSTYSITSVLTLTIYRHTLVATNAISAVNYDAGSLDIWATGQPSPSICISSSYPILANNTLVGASDTLTITFYSVVTAQKVPGLLFEPPVLTLTAAAPRQCVTIAADRSWTWESLGDGTTTTYSVGAYLGGRLAPLFQNPFAVGTNGGGTKQIWDFPHTVNVVKPSVTAVIDQSPYANGALNQYLLGESTQLRLYTDVLPPAGLNFFVHAPGATVTPVSSISAAAGNGRFAPATPGAPGQWQAYNVTFTGLAGDFDAASGTRAVTFALYLSSADAEFYQHQTGPAPTGDQVTTLLTAKVVKRNVDVSPGLDTIEIGATTVGYISLTHPVVNGLNVTIVTTTTGTAASAGVVVTPSSFSFSAGSANALPFTVTGQLLGQYRFQARLSGADADLFDLDNTDSAVVLVTVTKRSNIVFADNVLTSEGTLTAGVRYGPVSVTLPDPLLPGESITFTPFAGDFKFTPSSVTLVAGQSQALFSYVAPSVPGTASTRVFWSVTGPDAWKYGLSASDADYRKVYTIAARSVTVDLQSSGSVVPGVAHEGYVTIPFPATADLVVTPFSLNGAVSFNPAIWTFSPTTGTTLHFTWTVNAAQAFALSQAGNAAASATVNGVSINWGFLVNGTDAVYYTPIGGNTFTLRRPAFHMDVTYGKTNPNEQNTGFFVIGKWSPWYSISLSAPPAAGTVTLSLTDSKNVLEFDVDGTVAPRADLSFSADGYVQYVRFRFVSLLASDMTFNALDNLAITVSGTGADVYDYSAIYTGFANLKVVPALAISPIPAIYTNGHADGLFVAVKDKNGAIGGTWPFADDAQFSIHIVPQFPAGVVIEPSTLEFSKSQSNDPVQSFKIKHTSPGDFAALRQYTLTWYVRFAGTPTSSAVDITSIVPQDAQNVLLSRYQIIPKFPHVLSYGWQDASFNLSYAPLAHVSLTPRIPPVDGSSSVRGATTPAGRVDFEPPVLVAAPGQQVVHFRVKAQPGVDRDNLYYRVDWELHGHMDDLVNWVEYLMDAGSGLENNGGDNIYFATWHLASASVAQISFVALCMVCVLAVRNMF